MAEVMYDWAGDKLPQKYIKGEKALKTKAFYIWAGLSLLCAGAIFVSSSTEGAESGAASMAIAEHIGRLIGLESHTLNFLVRKLAHLLVFFLLGFFVANAVKYADLAKRLVFWLSFGISAAYGVIDELHQHFVPGRVFSALDIAINAAGAILGVGFVLFLNRAKLSHNRGL